MANETREGAPRPDDAALLRGALTALPIAIVVRTAAG
jgi:hypothetical protein